MKFGAQNLIILIRKTTIGKLANRQNKILNVQK